MKKTISILICLALVLSLIPVGMISASAAVVPVYYHYMFPLPGDTADHVEKGRTYPDGTVIETPNMPDRDDEGYVFIGWYADEDFSELFDFSKPAEEELHLYARWVKEEDCCAVWIYLDANAPEATAGVDVPRGDVYGAPDDPGREDAVFCGWYTDRALTKPYDPTAPIMEDTCLFPKWIKGKVCYVYIYSDPTDQDPYETFRVAAGDTFTPPAPYQFEGETFRDWYTDRRLTKPYDPSVPISENTELFPLYMVKAPNITGFNNGKYGLTIRWTDQHAALYRIFRKGPNDTSWKRVGETEGLSYDDETAVSGTTYTYTVRCANYYGNVYTSGYNSTGWKYTFYTMPVISKLMSATTGMSITWNKSNGVYGYKVFRRENGSWKGIATTTATSYTDKTVVSGNEYTYTVRAVDKTGKYITDYDRTGENATYVTAPKIAKIENTVTGAKIGWAKCNGAVKYRVFVKSGTSWKKLADTSSLTYVHTAAVSGKTYTYTVRALDAGGAYCSAYYSAGWKNQFIAAPAAPTLKNTKNGVQIASTMPAGAVKYCVFRKEYGYTKWTRIITNISATKAIVTDSTAKNGKRYTYTVRCLSKDGKSYVSGYNATGRTITCKR